MMNIIDDSADVLVTVGFVVQPAKIGTRDALIFEDATVLGFLFAYDDVDELIRNYQSDADHAIREYQFGLRRAAQKAWNVYTIFLSTAGAKANSHALVSIEEDLAGTRKIARADIRDAEDLHAALLPLLPIQAAPKLEAVDMRSEIRERAAGLPARAVDAFLSSSEQAVVLKVLEED